MAKYIYTFTKGGQKIEQEGYNLFNGAEKAGLTITTVDKLPRHYLQSTKFEDREHTIWAVQNGVHERSQSWRVTQRYNPVGRFTQGDRDFTGKSFRNQQLDGFSFKGCLLLGADLTGATTNRTNYFSEAKMVPMFCKHPHGITDGNKISFACQTRTVKEWNKFFASNDVIDTERDDPEFKRIEAMFRAYEAYLNHMGK